MKIEYKDADGRILDLEVSEEVGNFYLESIEAEKKNDRKHTRADRHTPLSSFEYEDIIHFSESNDILAALIDAEIISHVFSVLNDRQQYLIRKCFLEGWSYTDLAAMEGKDESAIRHAVNRAEKKMKNIFE